MTRAESTDFSLETAAKEFDRGDSTESDDNEQINNMTNRQKTITEQTSELELLIVIVDYDVSYAFLGSPHSFLD